MSLTGNWTEEALRAQVGELTRERDEARRERNEMSLDRDEAVRRLDAVTQSANFWHLEAMEQGTTIRKLEAQVERLQGALLAVEWEGFNEGSFYSCPWCDAEYSEWVKPVDRKHKPDCPRQVALNDKEA